MKRILIVEDELSISDLIKLNLNMVGYDTRQAFDGVEALELIKKEDFDLILLDIMLPKLDGFNIMSRLENLDTPIICLTAKNSIPDKVKGLRMGADDYIVKPFQSVELLARIEVVLRRYKKVSNLICFKDLQIYIEERIIKKDGKIIDLTLKEFELLLLLIKNKGMAFSREKILESVWGYDYFGETRTVDMHIQRIRKKLDLGKKIRTVYKIGYRLEE